MNDQDFQTPPEIKEDDPGKNGLMCFLDDTRECGPDCMGYVTEPVEAPTILGPQQKNCILIISAERMGRYMSNGVSLIKRAQDKAVKDAADKARTNVTPPPDPRGIK